jgi:hypothetical protein
MNTRTDIRYDRGGGGGLGDRFLFMKTSEQRAGAVLRRDTTYLNEGMIGTGANLTQTYRDGSGQQPRATSKKYKNTGEAFNNIGRVQKGGFAVRSGERVCRGAGGAVSKRLERNRGNY